MVSKYKMTTDDIKDTGDREIFVLGWR